MKNKNLHVRLTEEEYKKLKQLADKAGRSVSNYVRYLINKTK